MALNKGGTRADGLRRLTVDAVLIEIELTSTLDGDTVDITFYEDTDNDGTFENTETFSVADGTTTKQPSTLELSTGNDVYWELDATDDGDVTTALSNIDVKLTY